MAPKKSSVTLKPRSAQKEKNISKKADVPSTVTPKTQSAAKRTVVMKPAALQMGQTSGKLAGGSTMWNQYDWNEENVPMGRQKKNLDETSNDATAADKITALQYFHSISASAVKKKGSYNPSPSTAVTHADPSGLNANALLSHGSHSVIGGAAANLEGSAGLEKYVSSFFSENWWSTAVKGARGMTLDAFGGGEGKDEVAHGKELCGIPKLYNFSNDPCLFSGDKTLHIFFPLHIRWDMIDELLHSRWASSRTKEIDAKMVPWIILQEVFRCRTFGVPISFFSDFQGKEGNSNLYSVMHPMLRTMITGHVLGFLDFFLKGYLNGGTYSEDFIFNYEKSGRAIRKEALIDLQAELLSIRKSYEKEGLSTKDLAPKCACLRDFVEEEAAQDEVDYSSFAAHYTSSFRLLGSVTKVQKGDHNILEPIGTLCVESQLDLKPELAGVLAKELKDGIPEPKQHPAFVNAHTRMEKEIQFNMSRHPRFAPYFEMLKIITFCVGLTDSFFDAGVYPKSISTNSGSVDPITASLAPFPIILPPLPVRRGPTVTVEVFFDDMASAACEENVQGTLNKMIRNDLENVSVEERAVALLCAARKAAEKAVREKFPDVHAASMRKLDDGSLKTQKMASNFRQHLQAKVCAALSEPVLRQMHSMCFLLSDNDPIIPPEEVDFTVETYDHFRGLMAYAKDTFVPQWEEAALRRVNERWDNEKMKMFPNKQRNESFAAAMERVTEVIERKREENLTEVNQALENLLNDISLSVGNMEKDPLLAYVELDLDESSPLIIHKTRIKLGYTDIPCADDVFLGVGGGCGIKNESVLIEKSSAASHRHMKYCTSEVTIGGPRLNDNQRYFQLDIPFQHFGGDCGTLQVMYAGNGSLEDVLLLQRCSAAAGKNSTVLNPAALDSFGAHSAHFGASLPLLSSKMLTDSSIPKELLNRPGIDGVLPFHVACMAGNIDAVKNLIAAGVEGDVVLPSGLYPLLIACQSNYADLAILLLRKNVCVDVNRTTDTKVTPLHWAVLYRNPTLVQELIAHGAHLIGRQSDNATPMHLAAQIGCLDCLQVLVKRFPHAQFDQTSDNRIPLHYTCLGNHEKCTGLLIESMSPSERKAALLQTDKQSLSPFTLSLSLGHVHLALLLCEIAGIHKVEDAATSKTEERQLRTLLAEVPELASYFQLKMEDRTKKVTYSAFQEVTLMEYTKEKVIERCQIASTRDELIEECIRLRDPEFLKRVALYGSLSMSDIRRILVAVAENGLHDWPSTLSNCGVDICMKNIDGKGHDLLYLSAKVEEDEALLKAVWKEFMRFTPQSTHYAHLVKVLAATSLRRAGTRRTLLALFREVSGSPALGEADILLLEPTTSVRKWTFARSMGLRPSREGVINGAGKCRPSLIQRVISEGVGLQEDVRLHMLQEALLSRRMDNAYSILSSAWPDFRIHVRDTSNSSLASSVQSLVDRSNFPQFKRDLEEQEMVLKDAVMLQEINISASEAFFKKLIARQFYPMKNGTFGVYSWLLSNDTEKFECPWSAEIDDEQSMNGYVCSCKLLCENPRQVERVASSVGVSVEDLLNHPAFSTSLQLYAGSPLAIVEHILNHCPRRAVVAAGISSVAQLKDRSALMWNRLVRQAPVVLRELHRVLDTVVSADGITVLMRILPLPEASDMVEYAFQSKSIIKALKVRDRYGRSAAHHLVSLTGTTLDEKNDLVKDAINAIVTERLRKAIALHPGLLHQQDRQGYTLFALATKMNNTPAMWFLSTLAPVHVLDRPFTKHGYHALHVAAESGSVKAAKILVAELGLNPNVLTATTGDGIANLTPLHIAARCGYTHLFETLLNLGADPLTRNSRKETPLHWAVQYGDDEFYKLIRKIPGFWLLISNGELAVSMAANNKISSFYQSRFLKVTHPNRSMRSWNERTAFLEAVRDGTTTSIHELATAGADLLSFDSYGWNALHIAAQRQSTSILVQVLRYVTSLYSSAEVQNLLLQCTADEDSPIHIAAKSGCLGCIEILLSFQCVRNVSLRKQNNKGLSPSNVAALAGNADVAILLREANPGKAGNEFNALQAKHEAILRTFWSSVSDEARENARRKVARIRLVPLLNRSVVSNLSKDTEERWEKSWKDQAQALVSQLSPSEASILLNHPAFSSNVVRAFLVEPLKTSKSVVSHLLAWCTEEDLPVYTVRFCVEQVLLWEPVNNWTRIMNLFSSFSILWSAQEGQYPVEHHVLWDWLRLFFAPKKINHFYSAEFYGLLQRFLEHLQGNVVNFLPPPEVSIGDIEVDYSVSACEKLRAVNAALGEARTADEIQFGVSHLNYLWRRSSRWTLSMMTEGFHWVLLENSVFHRFGVRSFNSIHYLEKTEEPLTSEARAFVLEIMKEAPQDCPESTLMAWTTSATLAISVVGLDMAERVCSQLRSRLQVNRLNASQLAKYLPFLTAVVQSIVEIESESQIMTCVRQQSLSADDLMEEVTSAFKRKVDEIRMARLGQDRPVDELIDAFGRKGNENSPKFEPHSFSFDGTPIVTLPADELEMLRETILVAESISVSMYSSSHLMEEARRVGAAMRKQPNVKLLGQLIAYVREGVYRTMQKRPFRIQCMCLASFLIPMCMKKKGYSFKGRLAQVATGEGKSIIVAMVAATYALMGQTVDVITSSRPLATRDASEFAPFYHFWELRVSHIAIDNPNMVHFNAEVVYGTNTDFEFVQLREGCFMRSIRQYDPCGTNSWVPRPKMVSIVDEADNLFLDAAQNSARIAYSTGASFTWVYAPIFELVTKSKDKPSTLAVRKKLAEVQGGYYSEMAQLLSDAQLEGWVQAAHLAMHRQRDKDYIVRHQKVLIIDLDTGRIQESSRWSRGIHEMVEVKEGVPVKVESGVIGSVAHPSFFDGYSTVLGITGTAGEPEEREEIVKMYGIDSFDVPPHRPCLRQRLPTVVFQTKAEKQRAIVQSALDKKRRTSVLILVPTIKESNEITSLIRQTAGPGVCCLVLNETQRENEDFILLKASQAGTILVATNTAGRGTDIRPSKEVLDNGGLHVIYGAFPPNLRVECQGLGRSARQGQPGSNQIFISLDESFVRSLLGRSFLFDPDQTEECVKQLYAARTIQIKDISMRRARNTAVERVHFVCLKHFFEEQRWLTESILTMANNESVKTIRELMLAPGIHIQESMEELFQRLRECFRLLWVSFYTQLSDHRDPALELPITTTEDRSVKGQADTLYQIFLQNSKWISKEQFAKNVAGALREVFLSHHKLISRMETEEEQEKEQQESDSTILPPSSSNVPVNVE